MQSDSGWNKYSSQQVRGKPMRRITLVVVLAVGIALLFGSRAHTQAAATGGTYTLEWSVVGGGGGAASGGNYSIVSSVGQPGGGTARGGNYTLVGGIVDRPPPIVATPTEPSKQTVYLPAISR